jgi:predicted enzyme related to lactoylglutathione lyase
MSKHNVVHIEIPSTDPKTNAKFYNEAFGWKLEHAPEFDYWQFRPEIGPGGGFPGPSEDMGIKPGELLVYIDTDDIEASLAKIESLGGKTLMAKHEIPGTGWWAFFADPSGNRLALYKSMNPGSGM